jgi:preprotein translocase subunit SecE
MRLALVGDSSASGLPPGAFRVATSLGTLSDLRHWWKCPQVQAAGVRKGPTLALKIYKPGQGYWTRLLTAAGAGIILVFGLVWLANVLLLQPVPEAIVIASVTVVIGGTLYWIMNRPRIVQFLIDTDSEMRKVNWPSRREIYGSTWVVICGTILMAVLLFGIDSAFIWFFQLIGVLQS